jgi:phenylacetate-CoA ligase
MGALVVPGGGLSSAARLRIARDVGATVLAATPTYALRLAETAQAEGIDLPRSGIRAIIVAGEPGGSVASTKRRIETEWGARVFDHCGMTEVGPFGFECLEAPGGVHVVESEFIVEVLDLRSGQVRRASDGAEPLEGELVLTNLGRTDSPLVRYRTGDVVRWSTAPCPCGRPWGRLLGGILGRVDDMIFLRGNNLYPSAVEGVIRQFADVMEFRIHARKVGAMAELEIEIELRPGSDPDALSAQVAGTIERDLLFRARVRAVPSGALPRFELKGQRFFKEGF